MSKNNTNASRLAGKVAIVTGASKGIGAGIAKHLAAEGASVVVNYASSKADGERVAREITAAGGKAIAVGANFAKEADVRSLFAETKKAYGRLDILVNNAGVYAWAPLEQVTPEHFHQQYDLNVLGLLLASQEAARAFGEQGGSIINISSAVSRMGLANSAVYSGTKAAVDVITRALAAELGPKKIRVNAVNPGLVETEGTRSAGFSDAESAFVKQMVAQTPLGRIGAPDDIAPIVAFLASDEAKWVTGEQIFASGGMR